MPNPTLDALAAQVAASVQVQASAKQLIDGIAGRIQAAIDAAIAGGASAADLAPVQDEVDSLKSSTDALSTSVAANTVASPIPAVAAAAPAPTPVSPGTPSESGSPT